MAIFATISLVLVLLYASNGTGYYVRTSILILVDTYFFYDKIQIKLSTGIFVKK